MKMKISVQGCPYEDREELHAFARAQDIRGALCEISRLVRNRVKYQEIQSEEEAFLGSLLDLCRIMHEV